jgi:hypothetical protein
VTADQGPNTTRQSGEWQSPAQLAEDAARSARRLGILPLLGVMAAILGVTMFLRTLNLNFPMGQPAGMAAYVGRRWMHGDVPYLHCWDNQGPAVYLMAGVVTEVIGISPMANRLAMMSVDLATLFVLYALVRQWSNRIEALVAGGLFGFFSGALLVQGDCLSAGPALNFLYALAFLALLRSDGRKLRWLAVAGFALGSALCFRIVAWVYLAAILLWTVLSRRGSTSWPARLGLRPLTLLAFAAIPPAAFAFYFARQGALDEFWHSYVTYNWLYHWPFGRPAFLGHRVRILRGLAPEQAALWLFAGGWIIHAFSIGFRRETRLVAFWCIIAIGAALASRHVQTGDFIQTIPPLALASALAVTNPSERFLRRNERGRIETSSGMLIVFSLILAASFLYTQFRILRYRAASEVLTTDRAAYRVGRLIYENTRPQEEIYLWGSRPQIYVYAQRRAAHRFFYNWPLNDPRRVSEFFETFIQDDVFRDIYNTLTEVMPAFVVTTENYVDNQAQPGRLGPIAPWFRFMRRHYDLWKVVEAEPYSYTIFVRKDRKIESPPDN